MHNGRKPEYRPNITKNASKKPNVPAGAPSSAPQALHNTRQPATRTPTPPRKGSNSKPNWRNSRLPWYHQNRKKQKSRAIAHDLRGLTLDSSSSTDHKLTPMMSLEPRDPDPELGDVDEMICLEEVEGCDRDEMGPRPRWLDSVEKYLDEGAEDRYCIFCVGRGGGGGGGGGGGELEGVAVPSRTRDGAANYGFHRREIGDGIW